MASVPAKKTAHKPPIKIGTLIRNWYLSTIPRPRGEAESDESEAARSGRGVAGDGRNSQPRLLPVTCRNYTAQDFWNRRKDSSSYALVFVLKEGSRGKGVRSVASVCIVCSAAVTTVVMRSLTEQRETVARNFQSATLIRCRLPLDFVDPAAGRTAAISRAVSVAETILNWHYDGKLTSLKVCTMQRVVAIWERNSRILWPALLSAKFTVHGSPFIFRAQQFQRT